MKTRTTIEVAVAILAGLIAFPISTFIRENFVGVERAFAYLILFLTAYLLGQLFHRALIRYFGNSGGGNPK